MHIAKHMCMVQGKLYQMAEEWTGKGDPPEKYFSLARERNPKSIAVLENPKADPIVRTVEQLDWNELQKLKVKLGIKGQLKRPELVEAIKEAQNALEKRGQASL